VLAISASPSTRWRGTPSTPRGSGFWFFGLVVSGCFLLLRLVRGLFGFLALLLLVLVFGLLGFLALWWSTW
jgi:hypothetical protein